MGWGAQRARGNEINTAKRLLKIGFAPADWLYSESLTKSTKSTNTDVAATGLLWYGAVFRITFVSDFVSDVSGVSCFGPSP